ncbi:MAG: glycosyltransferase family 2 protein [Paracoccaceae bacterium]
METRTILTTMKNEGPFLLEWVAYNRWLGFTDFLVYTNDCDDGTDLLMDRLHKMGVVTHVRNTDFADKGPQKTAFRRAKFHPLIEKSDWILTLDADEFINIHTGNGKLDDMFAACPDANVISFVWRLFGNSGVNEYHDSFITETFTHCAKRFQRRPTQALGLKTLYRNDNLFQTIGIHRPLHPVEGRREAINWVNGAGKPMDARYLDKGWRAGGVSGFGDDLARLNHYSVRNAESFLVKRDRGRTNHVAQDQGLTYWQNMNQNRSTDTSIQSKIPAFRVEYDRLLADSIIADLHVKACAWHHNKIAELKSRPDYAEFFAAITALDAP